MTKATYPALPGRDVGEVRHPELVGALGLELPIDPIGGQGAFVSGTVVRTTLPRMAPRRPRRRMSRSTVQRATVMPSRLSCCQTLSAP